MHCSKNHNKECRVNDFAGKYICICNCQEGKPKDQVTNIWLSDGVNTAKVSDNQKEGFNSANMKYQTSSQCLKCKQIIHISTNDKEDLPKEPFYCSSCSIPCQQQCQHQWFELEITEKHKCTGEKCICSTIKVGDVRAFMSVIKKGHKISCANCPEVRIKWEDGEIEILNQ